jgi:hypothetical protein
MEKEYMNYVIGKTIPVDPPGDVDSQCDVDGSNFWNNLSEVSIISAAFTSISFWNSHLIPEGLIEDSV